MQLQMRCTTRQASWISINICWRPLAKITAKGYWPSARNARRSSRADRADSIDLSVAVRPIRIAQFALQYLAGGVFWQGRNEINRLRYLESADSRARETQDGIGIRLAARLQDHDGFDGFAPF